MSTTTLSSFAIESQLTTSPVTKVVTSSSEKKFIGKATFTNTSTSNVEVTIWRLGSATGATTGSGGNWTVKKTIPAGRTWACYEIMGHSLDYSQKISASAGTAGVINCDISGTTET